MKSFIKWCEENDKPLDFVKSEGSTRRAGVRQWAYPALYNRGQYPDLDLIPTAADAITYLSKDKKKD